MLKFNCVHVHMNGRVFDPEIARFLSADPFIQAPNNLQSYNRYSCALNNPLRYTDPSGYFFKKLWRGVKKWHKNMAKAWRKHWRSIVSIGMMFVMPGVFEVFDANTFWAGALTGATSGAVTGGSKGAWTGLLTGGLLHGAGKLGKAKSLFSKLGAKKVLAHGMIGGINSKLMGGKFAHGFTSVGFTQGANIQFGDVGILGSSVIGGTASKITGGEFKHGAIQGAMSHALNDRLHDRQRKAEMARKLATGEIKRGDLTLADISEGSGYLATTALAGPGTQPAVPFLGGLSFLSGVVGTSINMLLGKPGVNIAAGQLASDFTTNHASDYMIKNDL